MTFYIQKVTATGVGKIPSTVTFEKGLNIICGVSDSGKSGVLKSIYFLMGGDKPFDPQKTGYQQIELIVGTTSGTLSLTRKIGKNSVEVESHLPNIKSGIYDVRRSANNKNPLLEKLWLKLIDINEQPMVIKKQNFDRIHMTWKMLTSLYWLREENIESSKSIVLSMETTQQTAFLSSFVYLLTGRDFSDIEAYDSKEISTAKRNVLQGFVDGQVSMMSRRQREIQESLKEIDAVDVQIKIEELLDALAETEQSILLASSEMQDVIAELSELQEKATETQMIQAQFQELKSQYEADITRLTLIAEADHHHQELEENTECPFCHSIIQPELRPSYLETTKLELARIIQQLHGLSESERDVQIELQETSSKINQTEKQRDTLDQRIEQELTPHAKELKEALQHYRASVELKREFDLMQELSKTWNTELEKEVKDESEKKTEFRPREHFPEHFNQEINQIAFSILKDCHYENLREVHFNIRSFDLEINRLIKEDNHGKGYWAFINTVLGLTFRKYIAEHAKHKFGLFIVDTPLLGLDQGQDSAPDGMRTSLFEYLLNHQSEGQMIVVENKKDLPALDYEARGAKMIEFTHDRYPSTYSVHRYGFLYDVFGDESEEDK